MPIVPFTYTSAFPIHIERDAAQRRGGPACLSKSIGQKTSSCRTFYPIYPKSADLADYYQAVSRFDHGIGLLLDVLQRNRDAPTTRW